LHGVASGLELLERHFAVLRIQKDVPVLIAHGVWLAGGIAVFAVDVSEEWSARNAVKSAIYEDEVMREKMRRISVKDQ
jgi:hypothetical protein